MRRVCDGSQSNQPQALVCCVCFVASKPDDSVERSFLHIFLQRWRSMRRYPLLSILLDDSGTVRRICLTDSNCACVYFQNNFQVVGSSAQANSGQVYVFATHSREEFTCKALFSLWPRATCVWTSQSNNATRAHSQGA